MNKFLLDKEQVKLVCKMKGRENRTPQRAIDLLNQVTIDLPKNKTNGLPKQQGKSISIVVFP